MSLSPSPPLLVLHTLHLKNHHLSRRYARLRITLSRTRSTLHTYQIPTPGPFHPLDLPTPRAPSPRPPHTTSFFTGGPIHPTAPGLLARNDALVAENSRYERRIRRLERKISRTRGMVEELVLGARWRRAQEVREEAERGTAGERIVAALEGMSTGGGWC